MPYTRLVHSALQHDLWDRGRDMALRRQNWPPTNRKIAMPLALYALTAGAFGIGVTEFVIMGLLLDVSKDLGVSISAAGQLISGYALGVVIGAPLLTIATANWPRKTVLLALMAIFTLGNLACALAPDYWTLMGARIITA